MSTSIPTVAEVREALVALAPKQLQALSSLSGVPVTTLYNIRNGTTEDPRLGTAGAFWPHVLTMRAMEAPATEQQPEA